MEKENYYLLLELSVEPAEKDPHVIEEAIKKKQAEWSRYRNHPTKAIHAKRYIGLIPEIRKVMTDNDLRQKEAWNAKELLRQDEEAKFSAIERHLEILMSKGTITKKEMSGLAKMHGVKEERIHERLKKKEKVFKIDREIRLLMQKGAITDKKIATLAKRHAIGANKIREWAEMKKKAIGSEIDEYLEFRKNEGHITEQALIQLAHLYGIAEGDIHMRIKCPIRKQTAQFKRPQPLDKTLEKLINENLKIIGKSSLYDFLDLPPDSPLETLQQKAKEKETNIRRIGQKSAATTASGALAGHCIVLFKSKESRRAYDLTRSRIHLSDFNTDINAAGMDGKIRSEYFDILIKKAMKIGMDIEEAVEYVREYCDREKWVIKEKKRWVTLDRKRLTFLEKWVVELNPKKKSFWVFAAAVFSLFLIMGGLFVVSGRIIQASRIEAAYEQTLASLQGNLELEAKEKILKDFLARYEETEYAAGFRQKIRDIRKQMEQRDFEAALKEAEGLHAEKKYEDAGAVYDRYLKKHPKGAHLRQIKEKIAEIPALLDDRDYENLLTLADAHYTERIRAYNAYVSKHPEGRHIGDVKKLVISMLGEYHTAFRKELARCEKTLEWERCIQLCDEFIEKFPATGYADEAEGLKVKYNKRIQYREDLGDIRKEVEKQVADDMFPEAKEIYSDYLLANPELPSYMKSIVTKEIAELERRHKAYLREEKEWEYLTEYCSDRMNSLTNRVQRVEKYMATYPSGRYAEEAELMLERLTHKKKLEDERMRATRTQREWSDVLAYSKNLRVGLADRIQRLEKYIRENASGPYIPDASAILGQLKQEKAFQDERSRAESANRARIQKELQDMRSLVRQTEGRFVSNGNGTITDRKTGLIWSTLDSLADLGRCVDYQTAQGYVNHLNTGGYQWRIPTANELVGIYKQSPFFPSVSERWFWSADLVWHGWNKKAYIVTSRNETLWNRDQAELSKCGSVRAVRK